jgi:hypothetical protein
MNEKQIIAQLKGLRQARPNQEWIDDTKSHILGAIQPRENVFSRGFSISFFKMPRLQPAIIAPLIMILFVGAGVFTHFYFNSSEKVAETLNNDNYAATYLVLVETKLGQIENSEDIKEVMDILDKAVEAIPSTSKDTEQTAQIVASLASINEKVEGLDQEDVVAIQELNEKADILAAKTSQKLEENIKNTTAELVENMIKSLETKSLTEEQEGLFKEIKLDYNNKNYEQALEKILDLQK